MNSKRKWKKPHFSTDSRSIICAPRMESVRHLFCPWSMVVYVSTVYKNKLKICVCERFLLYIRNRCIAGSQLFVHAHCTHSYFHLSYRSKLPFDRFSEMSEHRIRHRHLQWTSWIWHTRSRAIEIGRRIWNAGTTDIRWGRTISLLSHQVDHFFCFQFAQMHQFPGGHELLEEFVDWNFLL